MKEPYKSVAGFIQNISDEFQLYDFKKGASFWGENNEGSLVGRIASWSNCKFVGSTIRLIGDGIVPSSQTIGSLLRPPPLRRQSQLEKRCEHSTESIRQTRNSTNTNVTEKNTRLSETFQKKSIAADVKIND